MDKSSAGTRSRSIINDGYVSKAGDESMVVTVNFENMADRLLVTDSPNRVPLRGACRSGVTSIQISHSVARTELIPHARDDRRRVLGQIFSYFGWKPAGQIISDIQGEVVDRR